MSPDKASQGERRKRRSFLPAPKKAAGLSPTSPQTTFAPDIPQNQPEPPQFVPSCPSVPLSQRETKEQPHIATQREDLTNTHKQIGEPAFGVGLRVGAKIRIGGIKPGILRYLGTTHLAPGIFCGIELVDPDGNHDGEVNGHRYFVCPRNHGIFAPKEKVCLDTSRALGRLATDSEVCYSSTESLTERTHKAFRNFEEGELEAVDCTKLSPILSPQEVRITENDTRLRQSKGFRASDKTHIPPEGFIEFREPSGGSQELHKTPSKKAQTGLPVAAKSKISAISAPHSKLPSFARTFTKYCEGYLFGQHSSSTSSHASDGAKSPSEAVAKSQTTVSIVVDTELDSEKSSPRHRTNSVRSLDDLEEDGFIRETLSTGVKKQLRTDSRQYLNFVFDEELTQAAADPEDMEGDIFQVPDLNDIRSAVTDAGYSDSRFIDHIGGHSYNSSRAAVSNSTADDIRPGEYFMKLETGTVMLKQEIQQPATTPERWGAIKSDSYTIAPAEAAGPSLDVNVSNSDTEDDGAGLSVTHSISDSDLPPDMLPHVHSGASDGRVACFAPEEHLYECDYFSRSNDDGSYENLNLTQTFDARKSESYIICHDPAVLTQSQSYTVCTIDPDGKRDSSKRERDHSVISSQSYTVSKTDSAASSPCRKYRKISTSSSANEGGDSSSSGTETKTDSSGENKGDNLDDSSTGASPEVSQALEWDYGQEFDGKIPLSHQDNTMSTSTSTGTSESLNDVLRDISEHSDVLIEGDPPSSVTEDSDQFETPDNEFENIDSLEDFPIFGKDSVTVMTDSGISDKDFDFCPNKCSSSFTVCGTSSDECSREDDASSHTTTRAISSDSSQETLAAEYVADTPGSVEDKDFLSDDTDMCPTIHNTDEDDTSRRDSLGNGNSNSPASVVSVEDASCLQDRTLVCDDLNDDSDPHLSSHDDTSNSLDSVMTVQDCSTSSTPLDGVLPTEQLFQDSVYDGDAPKMSRRERPISLLSTTSADTGYVPDSDSELATLTTNSPNTDWMDIIGVSHPTSYAPVDPSLTDGAYMSPGGSKSGHPGGTSLALCGHLEPLSSHKVSDDDDYNSDLTTNTEDDRIEADQVYGQWTQDSTLCADNTSVEMTSTRNLLENQGSGPESNNQLGNLCWSKVMDISGVREETIDKREEKDSKMEESVQQKKNKMRKAITITRRRSEIVDHKMPNTNVTSRLADYIKSPTPAKPKEDKEPKKKINKNVKNTIQKRLSVTDISNTKLKLDNSRTSSTDRTNNRRDESTERINAEKLEKPKQVIKRAPPKSKWGNIMSQIEASKDTVKPKPKSEIKSSLATYLSTPSPHPHPAAHEPVAVNVVKAEQTTHLPRRDIKAKLKQLPHPPPKIDLSKVKSKLNIPTAASAVKAVPKRDQSPISSRVGNLAKTSMSPGRRTDTTLNKSKRMSQGNMLVLVRPAGNSVSSAKNSHTDYSVCDSTESVLGSQGNDGVASKRGSVDLKPGRRSSSTHSYKSEHSDKARSRRDQINRAHNTHINNAASPFYYPRKSRTNGTSRVNSSVSQVTASTAAANAAKAEIIRLESLCEARTKELTHTKMQLRATNQAFDAMSVLVNYCCADLKAFECPMLARNLQTVQKQLTGCLAQIADLDCQKGTLENSLTQVTQEKDEATRRAQEACDTIDKEREEHRKVTQEMDDTHNAALTTQRDELTSKHEENVKKLTQFHDRQIDLLRLAHERQISDMKNENKLDMNALKISHLEEIQELRNKHDSQMEELHKQHRNKLEDITHRFESIKLTLSEKLESLRGECDELARRARNSEDALQRDADAKVQIALAPYLSLPKEIESLKTVLEMRNEEVQKLRSKNMDFEKQLEEIPIAREKIISLQQKVENLEAIINIKTDHEKQLHEKCQILMRKYDRESRANKRLSMDYEQVVWRMSQSSEFGSSESLTKRHFSRSPPRSKEGSPDPRHRAASPTCGQSDVIMRVKKRSSHSISEGDRKLRSRSETFVVEKTESSDSHSPSLSPQLKLKRWRKKSQPDEVADESKDLDQMCHSAGAEILPDLCMQQIDSSSLSLNDVNSSNMVASVDSYGRSSSAVSDSGMCDSISRSDVLDCSIVSTDSEWGTSINLSRNCDSNVEDLESGPETGDYHSLNNMTMIEVTGPSCDTDIGNVCMNIVASTGASSCENRAQYPSEDPQQSNNYHFSISLPQAAGDSVYDNNANSL
ncbi:hypothetical protein BsWGS_17916 [Bradybaena similaris]